MRDLDTQLQGLVAKNDGLLFALTITILLLATFIVGAVLWKAAIIKNHQHKEVDPDDEKTEMVNTLLCIMLVATKTFLHLPLFDIVFRTL